MLIYFLQTSICLLVFYTIYYYFLSKLTFFKVNRIYLLLSIILSLIIPIIEVPAQMSSDVIYSEVFDTIEINDLQKTLNFEFSNFGDWVFRILVLTYLTGVIVGFFKFFKGLHYIVNLVKTGKKENLQSLYVVKTVQLHPPFSFFKYIFISNKNHINDNIESILMHEKIHTEHYHSVDILFIEMVSILFWFNPILRNYRCAIRENHEYLADAEMCQWQSRESYCALLLKNAEYSLELHFANHIFQSQLKNRIHMMTSIHSSQFSRINYLLIFPAIVVLLVLFSLNGHAQINQKSHKQETEVQYIGDKEVHKNVDQLPLFPGCDHVNSDEEKVKCSTNNFLTYISNNLQYPTDAKKNNIQGMCVAQFTVNVDGTLSDIVLLKDIGNGCGDAVVQVINKMNTDKVRWTPGVDKGSKVNVSYTIPVRFKL